MLHQRNAPSSSLEEDFKTLGLGVDEESIHAQATLTIEEAVVGIGLQGHGSSDAPAGISEDDDYGQLTEDADDPIDGDSVTRELLSRIVNLPLDEMESDDFDAILESLKTKSLPEGDEELASLAEAVVTQLVEGKMQRIRKAAGGFMKKAKAGFASIGGKITRIATGKRIKKARERKKYMRGAGKVKANRWANTKGARNMKRLDKRKMIGSDLATDLSALVAESTVGGQYAPVMERIGSIFSMLNEQFCDEDVLLQLESTWDSFSNQITEDVDEEAFMESIKPVLIVIKRCLEAVESSDEAEADDDDDDDDGDDGGKGNDPT